MSCHVRPMQLSSFGVLFLALACGGQVDSAESGLDNLQSSLAYHAGDDGVRVSGTAVVQPGAAVADADLAVAVRWVITEELISDARRTSGALLSGDSGGALTLDIHEPPPAEALVANEATGREGVAVGYVTAYVDANASNSLDCLGSSECADYVVGGSPNALVVYADEAWPATGAPLLGFAAAGVRPGAGWSLVHLEPQGCEGRPVAREWRLSDSLELVVIGDFRDKRRCQQRSVNPDVD